MGGTPGPHRVARPRAGVELAARRQAEHLMLGTFGAPDVAGARALLERLRQAEPGRATEKVAALLRRCDELDAAR